MGWVIAIGLLLFFAVVGTIFNFNLLSESGMAGPWIATAACILVVCCIICYKRVKETWSIGAMMGTIGFFGLVQFIISFLVEMPSYWDGNEIFVRMLSAWGFQPFVCLLGVGISQCIVKHYDDLTDNLVMQLRSAVEKELEVLYEIDRQIVKSGAEYRRADHLADLLSRISEDDLAKVYKKFQIQKNETIINHVMKLTLENDLPIDVKEKTMSEIEDQVQEEIIHHEKKINDYSVANYSRKDYPLLKKMARAGR